jgi:glutaredoxin-like protein NrdH
MRAMATAVIVYTNPGCQPCRMTKKMLEQTGVSYTEVDLSQNDSALEHVKAAGHLQAPVVEAGSTSWSGFRPDLINALSQTR